MVLEITLKGRRVGTVVPLEGDRYRVEVTGVETSQPCQVFKGRAALVGYLDWLTDCCWSAGGDL